MNAPVSVHYRINDQERLGVPGRTEQGAKHLLLCEDAVRIRLQSLTVTRNPCQAGYPSAHASWIYIT